MPDAGTRIVRVITDVAEIEQHHAAWSAAPISRHDADVDFYLAFAASRPTFVRPHVMLVEHDGDVEAVLVARVEDVRIAATLGYRALFHMRMRAITLVHGGLAGVSESNAGLLVGALRDSLARGEADVLSLAALPTEGPLYKAAIKAAPPWLRQPLGEPQTHRRLAVPDTYDEFLRSRSKSTRDSVKRYRRKVERELGDRLELRCYRDPSDLDTIFTDTEPVAAKTYQRGLGVALADTPEQRPLIEVGLRQGWFRTYVVYLEGTPIAFWPGYAYRGVFFIGTPGYDPAYADYRIGMYLQMRMMEDFCAEPEIRFVDYGFGDAEYKRRFGSESWEERDLMLVAPRPRPVAFNAVRSGVFLAAQGAAAVLERAGLLDRVKRAWRRRLGGGEA
jgi:hypothetical protein